jgi:hypothetical protein
MSLFPQRVTSSSQIDFINYNVFLMDASSNSLSVTLPDPNGLDGNFYIFNRIDTSITHTVTLNMHDSDETYQGNAPITMTQNDLFRMVASGGQWYNF